MTLRGPALLTLLAVITTIAESDYKDLIAVIFIVFLCLAINSGSKSRGDDN